MEGPVGAVSERMNQESAGRPEIEITNLGNYNSENPTFLNSKG